MSEVYNPMYLWHASRLQLEGALRNRRRSPECESTAGSAARLRRANTGSCTPGGTTRADSQTPPAPAWPSPTSWRSSLPGSPVITAPIQIAPTLSQENRAKRDATKPKEPASTSVPTRGSIA
eukprot:8291187-Pyramimonas_sp.AAC.1